MTYTISSHSDARLSSIHGSEYETYEEAMAAIRGQLADEPVEVRVDDAWLLYSDQEDADADDQGQAPHKVIAVIRES